MRAYEFITEAELPGIMGQAEKTRQALDLSKGLAAADAARKEAERQQATAWQTNPAARKEKESSQALQTDPISQTFTPGVSTAQDVGDVAQGDLGAAPYAALGMAPVVGGPLSKFAKKVFGRERKATQVAADVGKVPTDVVPAVPSVDKKQPAVWRKNEQPPADRLVRVQPSIDNLIVNKDGTVSIAHGVTNPNRPTSHWTQNSVVGSHEMGDWDKSGYAIIADPRYVKAPMLGARPEDTWYALDKNKQLNIGQPTILAPKGAPVPKGMNVLHYDDTGGAAARNAAIQQTLQSQGAPYRGVTGKFGLADVDDRTNQELAKTFASKYHNKGPATMEPHLGSIHSRIEGGGRFEDPRSLTAIRDRIDAAKQGEKLARMPGSKIDMTNWEIAQQSIRDNLNDIRSYIKANPEAAKYQKDYWQNIISSHKQLAADAEALRLADKGWGGPGSFKNLPGPKPIPGPPPLPPAPVLAISKPGAK